MQIHFKANVACDGNCGCKIGEQFPEQFPELGKAQPPEKACECETPPPPAPFSHVFSLTIEERQLLHFYRQLNPDRKQEIWNLIADAQIISITSVPIK